MIYCNCNQMAASDVEEMAGCDYMIGQSLEEAIGVAGNKQ
jgi:hypothetical protein